MWHPARPSVLLVLLSNPLCQPPPPGSSFITLTWETQRDFFHPRALMLSLPKSPRCPFYTLFRRRHPSPPAFFSLSPCPLFYADDLAILFHLLFALYRFFSCRVESHSLQSNTDKLNHPIFLRSIKLREVSI